MTEAQPQTSTYGETTQAAIGLVRVLGDWGKQWLNSRADQRRMAKNPPVTMKTSPESVSRPAATATTATASPQAANRSVDAPKPPATVPAPAPSSREAMSDATVRALNEQARAAEARREASLAELKELVAQLLAARRAAAPAVIAGQAAPTDAATVTPTCAPPDSAQISAAPAVVSVSKVAEAIPEAASSAPVQHSAQLAANPVFEPPLVENASSVVAAESASPDLAKPEALSDRASHQAASAEAARTVTTEKPETAPSTPPPTAEPELTPAQRRAKWLSECKDPHVQSWRMIKSFVRRMTDFDLLAFTSSLTMFRAFLSMLRAMTPYYEGPKLSLEDLAPDGMPFGLAMLEQAG